MSSVEEASVLMEMLRQLFQENSDIKSKLIYLENTLPNIRISTTLDKYLSSIPSWVPGSSVTPEVFDSYVILLNSYIELLEGVATRSTSEISLLNKEIQELRSQIHDQPQENPLPDRQPDSHQDGEVASAEVVAGSPVPSGRGLMGGAADTDSPEAPQAKDIEYLTASLLVPVDGGGEVS